MPTARQALSLLWKAWSRIALCCVHEHEAKACLEYRNQNNRRIRSNIRHAMEEKKKTTMKSCFEVHPKWKIKWPCMRAEIMKLGARTRGKSWINGINDPGSSYFYIFPYFNQNSCTMAQTIGKKWTHVQSAFIWLYIYPRKKRRHFCRQFEISDFICFIVTFRKEVIYSKWIYFYFTNASKQKTH